MGHTIYTLFFDGIAALSSVFTKATLAAVDQGVVSPPQIPLDTIYSKILEFFLTFQPSDVYRQLGPLIYAWKFIGTYFSLAFIIGIYYVSKKIKRFKPNLSEVDPSVEVKPQSVEESAHQRKWQRVVDHVESTNPNDWRLAILEADILLDEMLDLVGAQGNTLGDKLKSLTSAELPALQKAWEAHKIRNLIAHEGADFVISQREARRVMLLYREVLKQGLYI